ncbi:ABC transporter permease [Solwaraspora sp. WMMD406]|uniref:ABC transporter permease n=1 Tax=Solwaraspora sp. WMMD406 TaxID=3016095 RepID=UPI002417B6E2|nr:ABC transporter permease [Solwaraspora sp. WMMD406]MDG4766747.1 ABC transporter permease [Solwaraspora sp. WMMD406]
MTRRVFAVLLRNRLAVAGLVVLAGLAVVAAFGAMLAPYDPNAVDVPGRLAAPSPDHLFGTDNLGRDVFSRVLVGARVSLRVGFVAVGISLTAGLVIGLVAGFYSGPADSLLMRTMDVLFAFPAILLAIAVLAILGPGITNAMIAIGIVYTPIFARIVRAATTVVATETYVRAARAIGASDLRILLRHVLPNITAPVIVQTSLSLAFAILAEAALSFLGLGVQRPDPAWGRMLAEGREFVSQAPWMGIFPGLAVFCTVLAFNVVGDALRDALDPRQRSVIESRGRTG